ncbi:hypothetical protein [Sulfurimonas sp.]|uniref:hypothetical protein n=1 Tax=Sulfurimonas sp. TaxID=2022749 RepID=UPI003568FCF9
MFVTQFVVNGKDGELLYNELRYVFGEPFDVAVDLHVEIKQLKVRDRLMVAN